MAEAIFIKYYEDTDCLHGYGVERTVELTRQEAIERMAKGMFTVNWNGRYSWDNTDYVAKKHFIAWAEVALNALLDKPTIEERVEEITKNNPGIPDYDKFYKALKEGK